MPSFKSLKTLVLLLPALTALLACEKAITFDLDEEEPRLVVDATIEAGQPPVVILTTSFSYFSEINAAILDSLFVHDAIIRISDGTRTHQLKEYARKLPASTLYYYSIDSASLSTAFTGTEGQQYTLSLSVNGREYTAQTTIPVLDKKVDSLWWKPSPNNPDTSKVVLMARVSDPPGYGDYIRFFTSVNQGPFNPGLNSVFDDQIVDGTNYDTEVEKGVDRNEEIDFETYSFFERGDTVLLKFTNIDKDSFEFWRTMEFNYSSIGNPFSNPVKVLGNIRGGALGYFGGYAVQFQRLVIPK